MNEILVMLGAGPVLATSSDPVLGPLSALFLLPYAAAVAGAATYVLWLINKAMDRHALGQARG